MSPLQQILTNFRNVSQTEREKGTYFEELIRTYFRYEATYAGLYSDVWLYADWAKEIGTPQFGLSAKDTGIDSFFTASGQKPFVRRIIVSTTNDWSENAENSLVDQTPPVTKIDL